ncbi:MAG: SpoIID/LytB domain-containing protein [Candidatus Babeliaceae bacterium]|nr:SpoIID/LytB domain-containing protein [Candidatus Babeliaceae bacterium]
MHTIIYFFLCISSLPLYSACSVRVLLEQGDITQTHEWLFVTPKKSFLCIFSNGMLSCNGKKVDTTALRISSTDNRCSYQDNVYAGDIALIIADGHFYVINTIPLEEYVYSVIRSEGWPGWPLEVNKVFAIMVRTYAVHKIMLSKNGKKRARYDIKSTNIHQTYKGVHDLEHLHQAVQETKGLILAYNKQPIVAMYDSCCGGVIPAQLNGFDFKMHPYLARAYPCTYCADCKLYRWKSIYSHDALVKMLHVEFPGLKHIKDIHVLHADKAGKVGQLHVKTTRSNKRISGTIFYRLCKDIKSFCYTIKKEGSNFIFEGKGFGHHVGVCQWGVRGMVKQGFMYKEILDYYYPGTKLMKLTTNSKTSASAYSALAEG